MLLDEVGEVILETLGDSDWRLDWFTIAGVLHGYRFCTRRMNSVAKENGILRVADEVVYRLQLRRKLLHLLESGVLYE